MRDLASLRRTACSFCAARLRAGSRIRRPLCISPAGLLSAGQTEAASGSREIEASYHRLLQLLHKTAESLDQVRLQSLGLVDAVDDEMFTLGQASGE